jgi:hypothetical protein
MARLGYVINIDKKSKFIHDIRIKVPMFNDVNISEIISNYVKITDNGNRVESYFRDMLIMLLI